MKQAWLTYDLHACTRGKAQVPPYLTSHFILGGLAQELDVSDLAIGVEGVHEDAEAPAWRRFFVVQICKDPIFGLCLHVQRHCWPSGQELLFDSIAKDRKHTGNKHCVARKGLQCLPQS